VLKRIFETEERGEKGNFDKVVEGRFPFVIFFHLSNTFWTIK
jgi:hypothetical protein